MAEVTAQVVRMRKQLAEKNFREALALGEALAVAVPENRDVLYMVAVSQRFLGCIPDALGTLGRLETHHPAFSHLFQERGQCYVALRDAPNAIEAFVRAVNLNPALLPSWRALQTLHRMAGESEKSLAAAAQTSALGRLPGEILNASVSFYDGDLTSAEAIVRAYLLKHGNHIEGMRLLARIGLALDVTDDAETLLEAVLAITPDYHAARYDYAITLLRRHKHIQAIAELDQLLRLDPHNRMYATTYATAHVGLGDHERALTLYRELLAGAKEPAELHLSIAHSLKTLGRQAEAIDSYHAAALARPSYGDAYWSLANLKTYRFSDEQIGRMRAQQADDSTSTVDRYHLCFALGKALEDRGVFAESYHYYERGNALKKAECHYRPEELERVAQLQTEVCNQEFFAARRGVGCADVAPIFIVGLPRSGSTLLEQILASHSLIEGTMELADIPRTVLELQGRHAEGPHSRYPRVLAELSSRECLRLGQKYIDDTRVYRRGKPFFIDKMPNNFRHIGLIQLILPQAKIIDARRDPMACCFSNFKQLFASGQEFTYSIEDIARYYRTYLRLMEHWDAVLPGKVLHVQHEDVVADLEGNVRRILEFCGVEFEPACLEFYRTERSVRTASSEQVRQPIFTEGLEQWRNFAPWLSPLEAALGRLTG